MLLRIGDSVSTLQHGIRSWTIGGLPRWLFLPGFRRHWSKTVRIAQASGELAFKYVKKGDVLDIELDEALFLKKELVLPVAAKSNIDNIVALQARQSMPNGGADLVWRYRVKERSQKAMKVEILFLKQRLLNALVESANQKSARIRTIRLAGAPKLKPFFDASRQADRAVHLWSIVALACLLALLAQIGIREMAQLRRLSEEEARLQQIVIDRRSEAIALRNTIETQQADASQVLSDIETFSGEYQRLPILVDLTNKLPDDVWLTELSINRHALNISGFSKTDITEIIGTLRNMPWVERVELESPISFDSFSRSNRFDLFVALHSGSVEQL